MLKKPATNRKGFTIVELMAATVFLGIVTLGIGIVLADSHKGYNTMYDRIYSDVVTEGYVARRVFDSTVRKAGRENILVDEAGTWIEVRYYQDSESTALDRYARFYVSGEELKVEYGNLDPGDVLSTRTVCSNVYSCVFSATGSAAQMILRLDNGSETVTVVSSAVAHN
jgi:Tfp pilus assembly protein PilW